MRALAPSPFAGANRAPASSARRSARTACAAGRAAACAAARGSAPSSSAAAEPCTTSRRDTLLAGLATLALLHGAPARAAALVSGEAGMDEYNNLLDAGKLNSAKAVEDIRAKYGFKRSVDGRVYIKGKKNWFAVRLDMEVPGTMLFRDSSTGQIYALQAEALQQIDLSSDPLVILMLSDGTWEQEMSPITVGDDSKTLTMSEVEFRSVVGIVAQTEGNGAPQ